MHVTISIVIQLIKTLPGGAPRARVNGTLVLVHTM